MQLLWDLKRQAWLVIQLKGVRALHNSHKATYTAKAQVTFCSKVVSYQGRALTKSEGYTDTVDKFWINQRAFSVTARRGCQLVYKTPPE